MKAVVQKHLMGCGIACVAFVTKNSYDIIFRTFDSKYASTRGYYCKELIKALEKFGLKYDYKKVNEKTKHYLEKEDSIIFIKRSVRYPSGHYLVYTKEGWMNPWINYPSVYPVKAGFDKKLPGEAHGLYSI